VFITDILGYCGLYVRCVTPFRRNREHLILESYDDQGRRQFHDR
jgi:hypothetical protein